MVTVAFGTVLLGAIVTKLVDLFRKFDKNDNPRWKPLWLGLSMALGVGIALIWQINGLTEAGIAAGSTRLQGVAGQILTGLLVGGFGSGWHELFDTLSGAAKNAHVSADAKRQDLEHQHGLEKRHGAAGHAHA